MVAKGDIAIRKHEYFDYEQHRVLTLRSPQLDNMFNVEQMNLVMRLILRYWGKSGKDMSDESHAFMGWSAANLKETIPYSVALVGTRGPTKDEIRRGLELQSMAEECLTQNAVRKASDHHRGA
jgi:hypothetical protein